MMREMDFVDEYYADKDLSLLKKLTLVIPTYNRNYYLSRCLWYHAHFPFGEIIVADSSPEEKKVVNRETVQKIREMFGANIRYLEYEPETEKYGGDIYRKWGDAVQHVETEYSQIVTDKEFLIPITLTKCIECLDENADISICEGHYYYIESLLRGKGSVRNMYPSKTALLQNDAIARLNAASSGKNKSCNQMGIRKTEFHKRLYKTLSKHKIDDIRFGEFTLEFLTIIRSKSQYLDQPYLYRDICNLYSHNNLQKSESSSLRYPYLDTYITENIYTEYFRRFTDCLTPEIVSNSSLNMNQAQNYVQETLPQIIQMRGFYGNTKLTQDPLWYLWRRSPALVRSISGHIFPKKYLDYRSLQKPEEMIIAQIIENTKRYNFADTPIVQYE